MIYVSSLIANHWLGEFVHRFTLENACKLIASEKLQQNFGAVAHAHAYNSAYTNIYIYIIYIYNIYIY